MGPVDQSYATDSIPGLGNRYVTYAYSPLFVKNTCVVKGREFSNSDQAEFYSLTELKFFHDLQYMAHIQPELS